MRQRHRQTRAITLVGMVVAALSLASGCNEIFGLDPLEVQLPVGQGGSAAGGAAEGGTAQSGGGGQSPGGSGGEGGAAVCDASTLGTASGCEAAEKCGVLDIGTGEVGCVPAGPRPAWSRCDLDAQCTVGTWCGIGLGVCQPICNHQACDPGGNCVGANNGNFDVIPGLEVCTADCEPVGATPCSQAHGDVSCVRLSTGLDCSSSGGLNLGQSCNIDAQCGPGLSCWEASTCYQWCRVGGSDCSVPDFCLEYDPPVLDSEGNEYGICAMG